MRRCPALLLSGPASNQGKTTVTAALARFLHSRGRKVRAFKSGPDFLDPMILERASGAPVYNLDLYMGGENHCRRLLYDAADDADLILIEGVMGLFDGSPSSADLAALLGVPVVAVIDGSAMAQTFGALAQGLAGYRPGLPFAGVFANNLAGERHYRMLAESLPPAIPSLGWLARDAACSLPHRHLGLMQASEIEDLDRRIEGVAERLHGFRADALQPIEWVRPGEAPPEPLLRGRRIAIARDPAFGFLYRANLDLLRALGAQLTFFSPIKDQRLPPADALYLPGGYPELHLDRLAENRSIMTAIGAHHGAGKPIVAECGGMLYLLESLTDAQGRRAPMAGLLPGRAVMQNKLANLGIHSVQLPGGEMRGHSFHYSRLDLPIPAAAWSRPRRSGQRGEPLYRLGNLQASYVHLYFPSNPRAAARLFDPTGARDRPGGLTGRNDLSGNGRGPDG